jgi:hypothetical protein
MATVAQRLRRESVERAGKMSPAERLSEALALGQAAVQAYAHAHKVSVDEARRRLERAGQAGRRASQVMLGILE